ncbi:MAG TPA: DUF488 domain-containing protein [Burkholderiales bacterium]|nr:DUF488 domain-containing protein [Burkholderiales bacterium]
MIVWTIGHSTRRIEDFVALLAAHEIRLLIDVRRFPASRRHPQFHGEALAARLAENAIDYRHISGLGGRRNPRPDSPNTAWRERGFRGYADYMDSGAFQSALADLLAAASARPAAIMCAEARWRRCHRGLIADALKSLGWKVVHIVDAIGTEEHPYTAAARVIGGRLTYAPAPVQQDLDL